ncbi:sensor histidine kinase [Tardiphaga sp. 604_B6_N1_1]|uniref:sensor histidine kinase n=1 Tax=unclassified Tardiphaga TaxID=2631404 RepID=UPI003F289925
MPRSIVAWFVTCWLLFLVAAVIVGAMMFALYRDSTSQRFDRARAIVARACNAISQEIELRASANGDYSVAAVHALESFQGVEGGIWKSGTGSLGYAFPTYEGSSPKTDLPQAELPAIREVAEAAAVAKRPVDWRRDSRSQSLLITACPLREASDTVAWAMTRVVTTGGRAYLLAVSGLGFLLVVLCISALLLGRVLWRWSSRLGVIERSLALGDRDLPILAPTGQRDLDRIVKAINGASSRASDARRHAEGLLQRVAEGERMASLGRVAAGVAHEIRNPITAMRLKAENALANPADRNRSADALNVVVDQVGRMDLLLQNLLRSVQRSRIARERVIDLRGFLAEHVSLFREQGGRRVLSLECPVVPGYFDRNSVGRAVDNMILNAIQNSADGTRIEVTGAAIEQGVRIDVADHGYGVPEEVRDHLFEPFATGRPDGTGLGLAIVREVAEAHGGNIAVQHRIDGTTFMLTLPFGEPGKSEE